MHFIYLGTPQFNCAPLFIIILVLANPKYIHAAENMEIRENTKNKVKNYNKLIS